MLPRREGPLIRSFAMPVLRVATFNIHHGRGLDGLVDLERTASIIKETGARLIALQELDRGLERSGLVDQPLELTRLTGMQVQFCPTLQRGPGSYGIGVACDEALDPEFHLLPQVADEERRAAITVEWQGLHVTATHISSDRRAQKLQIPVVAELATGRPGPAVLMGDLNATWSRLGVLAERSLWPARGHHRTVARRVWREIDFVLAGGGARVERSWTIRSRASDHFPKVAQIAY